MTVAQQGMLDERSEKNLIGVHPSLVHLCYMMADEGHNFYVTAGARTVRQQQDLYAQGRTKPGAIVTWTLDSKHLIQSDGFGHAFDFAPRPVDWNNISAFELMGKDFEDMAVALGISIEWGGRWKRKDMPHIQLIG